MVKKCIFKIKQNGIFRARFVACGYSQVPGVDVNKSFAPVINDVSFRIMLIVKLIWGLQASIVDVETSRSDLYVYFCLLLKKAIYGLVQRAREFCK